jgi:hypothetical protein
VNPDGSGEFEVKIDGLALKMSIGPITLNYDSKTYDPNAKTDLLTGLIARIFNAMNGMAFNMTLSPTGQAIKMQGLSAIVKKVMNAIANEPGNKDNAMLKSMADQLSSSLDDNAFGQELQSLYRMVPAKPGPYKIGDKWDNSWETKMMGMAMTGRGEYQLVGIETYRGHPCAKISTQESVEVAKAPPAGDGAASKSKSPLTAILDRMDIKATSNNGQGIAYIDCQTGVVVSMKGTQNIDMVMSMKADPQARNKNEQQGFTMSESFRTSVTAELVEPGTQDAAADVRTSIGATTKPAGAGSSRDSR